MTGQPVNRLRENFWPLIKFGLVGVANTGVYYACYLVLLVVMPYLPAHLIAWAVSMVFSFYMNCLFTYRVKPTWRKLVSFPLASLPNVVFTTFGVVLLVETLRVPEQWAPLIAGILAVPFSYVFAKWLLVGPRRKDGDHDQTEQGEPAEASAE